jgi:plastocyanin
MLILASVVYVSVAQNVPRPVQANDPTFPATIANYAFKPQHINVTTGTQVIWTNNDGVQHTVTSAPQTNMTQGGGPLISSGPLNQGQSFSYTFYTHGFYPYQCGFHPYMTGWVNVTGSDVQPPSSPMTTSSIDYTPYIISGVVAGAVVIVSLALFFRRRAQRAGTTSPLRPS